MEDKKKRYPIQEGLFSWPSDEPALIGARCKSCGVYSFPSFQKKHKPGCKDPQTEKVQLSRRGKLASFTVQRYRPPLPFKTPETYVPYAIGWVALPEGIAVAGIITGCKPEDVKMNMDVQLVVEKAWEEEDGSEPLTWKWRPV